MDRIRRLPAWIVAAGLGLALAATVLSACGTDPAADAAADAAARAEAAADAQRERITEAAAVRAAGSRGAPVLSGSATTIDGRRVSLERYRGSVVVAVNLASRCGFTDQMGDWQRVWERNRDAGLVVLGFPSDDFRQEPRSDGEIATFCERNYGVDFPLFAKASVRGPGATAPYDAIARRPPPQGGPPTWNFTGYAIDRQGRLAARIEPGLGPDSPRTSALLATLLAEPGVG